MPRSTRGTVSDIHDMMRTQTIVFKVHHNVADTRAMVSDIHRTIVKGQEGSDGISLLVSDIHTLSVTGCSLSVV